MTTRTAKLGVGKPKVADKSLFVQESRQAMAHLQEAVRGALAALSLHGARPTDLGKALELDYALAWQIHAIANQPDRNLTSRVLPKPGSMERFFQAVGNGASSDLAQGVREAYGRLEQVILDHAGDRETFDAMLTLHGSDDAAGLIRLRRAAHRANAAVWGLTCRSIIRTIIVKPRPTGELDCVVVHGHVGLQKLHPDAVVSIPGATRVNAEVSIAPEGIQPAELIEAFCSQPLPRIDRVLTADNGYREFVELDALGKQGEITVFWRNKMFALTGGIPTPIDAAPRCRTPAEVMLVDYLLPSSHLPEETPSRAWLIPDAEYVSSVDTATRSRLPFEGNSRYLGTSLSSLHSSTAPQYVDLIRAEIANMGWSDTEFAIYRCEVKFPILHSAVHLRIG